MNAADTSKLGQSTRASGYATKIWRLKQQDAHLLRMSISVMKDESPDPVDVGLLRPIGVMLGPQCEPQPIEQPGRLGGRDVDCRCRRTGVYCGQGDSLV